MNNYISNFSLLPNRQSRNDTLNISNKGLQTFPEINENIKKIYCQNNLLTNIPQLPHDLIDFNCSHNKLSVLPKLPNRLIYFNCEHNTLQYLPNCPISLQRLFCNNNRLKSFNCEYLPQNLYILNCNYNELTELPKIFSKYKGYSNLRELHCSYNNLTHLPELVSQKINQRQQNDFLEYDENNEHYETLELLECRFNKLTSLPPLPSTLNSLDVGYNNINVINEIPFLLEYLVVSGNSELVNLPPLPNTLKYLAIDNTNIKLTTVPSHLIEIKCDLKNLVNTTSFPKGLLYKIDNNDVYDYQIVNMINEYKYTLIRRNMLYINLTIDDSITIEDPISLNEFTIKEYLDEDNDDNLLIIWSNNNNNNNNLKYFYAPANRTYLNSLINNPVGLNEGCDPNDYNDVKYIRTNLLGILGQGYIKVSDIKAMPLDKRIFFFKLNGYSKKCDGQVYSIEVVNPTFTSSTPTSTTTTTVGGRKKHKTRQHHKRRHSNKYNHRRKTRKRQRKHHHRRY